MKSCFILKEITFSYIDHFKDKIKKLQILTLKLQVALFVGANIFIKKQKIY